MNSCLTRERSDGAMFLCPTLSILGYMRLLRESYTWAVRASFSMSCWINLANQMDLQLFDVGKSLTVWSRRLTLENDCLFWLCTDSIPTNKLAYIPQQLLMTWLSIFFVSLWSCPFVKVRRKEAERKLQIFILIFSFQFLNLREYHLLNLITLSIWLFYSIADKRYHRECPSWTAIVSMFYALQDYICSQSNQLWFRMV